MPAMNGGFFHDFPCPRNYLVSKAWIVAKDQHVNGMSCKLGLVAVIISGRVLCILRLCSCVTLLIPVIISPPSDREGSVRSEEQSCMFKVTRPDMFSMLNERMSIELGSKANVLHSLSQRLRARSGGRCGTDFSVGSRC